MKEGPSRPSIDGGDSEKIEDFMRLLQERLDEQLATPPEELKNGLKVKWIHCGHLRKIFDISCDKLEAI